MITRMKKYTFLVFHRDYDTFLDVIDYFKRVINLCKQMNYCEFKSKGSLRRRGFCSDAG